MGPLFVIFTWMFIGVIVLIFYSALHVAGKRSPVALQLKKIMPAFIAASVIPLAILALLNFCRIIFKERTDILNQLYEIPALVWLEIVGITLLVYFVALGLYRKSPIVSHVLNRVLPALLGALIVTFLLAFVGKWLLNLFYQ